MEFGRLLEKIGIVDDPMLIDKVFFVFDEDGGGSIGLKELGIGLEMMKNNKFEEKLDTFFDLCDEDNTGTIDKKEFYSMLRLNATTSYEDRERLKFYVNQIFNKKDDINGATGPNTKKALMSLSPTAGFTKSQTTKSAIARRGLTREELKEACKVNPQI